MPPVDIPPVLMCMLICVLFSSHLPSFLRTLTFVLIRVGGAEQWCQVLWGLYKGLFLASGLMQLLQTSLSFAAPLLLKALVRPPHSSVTSRGTSV